MRIRRFRVVIGIVVMLFAVYFLDLMLSQPLLLAQRSTRLVGPQDRPFETGCGAESGNPARANATFLMLCQNSELPAVLNTLQSVKESFNCRFNYPYVFLNNEPFSHDFRDAVEKVISNVTFHIVPPTMWGFPTFIDQIKAKIAMNNLEAKGVRYGGQEDYHHMCRFFSGMFYKHEALKPYKWYWRLEPGVQYFCRLSYDPFLAMERAGKIYGFTMSLWELGNTVHSLLWKISEHYKIDPSLNPLWAAFLDRKIPWPLPWILTYLGGIDGYAKNGFKWSMCHFWSNFEIASLDWFRSREYNDFFNTIDRLGGIYYERWGDASIHSLGAGLLLRYDQVHFFEDIGYRHDNLMRCPSQEWEASTEEVGCECNCTSTIPARRIQSVCIDAYKASVRWDNKVQNR